jgi:hypothetical protein
MSQLAKNLGCVILQKPSEIGFSEILQPDFSKNGVL